MAYSLFYTDVPLPPGRPDPGRMIPASMESLSAARDAACKLIGGGAVVWQIKGTEGFLMERTDVEIEYSRRHVGM